MARCVAETRALTHAAKALRDALERGDTPAVKRLVEEQEVRVWRLGRLMRGEGVEGGEAAPGEGDAAITEIGARDELMGEMAELAEVSRQNAVLVTDGLRTVQGLLRILTGRAGDYRGHAPGAAHTFSRKA